MLISIEDDGGGLQQTLPAGMSLGRMGLTGMEERLRALGGQLMIEETRDLGVRVRAFIPKVRKLEIA